MKRISWGWKVKYMILFLWIFLFSCKAQHAEEQEKGETAKKAVAASGYLWQWIQAGAADGK
ncbi:MAG TPA: hypothetical protein VGE66_20050 [Chitinophagaceae bacterium]